MSKKSCGLPQIDVNQTAVVAAPQARGYELANVSDGTIVTMQCSGNVPLTPRPPPQAPSTDQTPTQALSINEANLSTKLEEAGNIVKELRGTDVTKLIEDASLFKMQYRQVAFPLFRTNLPNTTHQSQFVEKYIDSQLPELMSDMWREITRKFDELRGSYSPSMATADLWDLYYRDHQYLLVALSNFSRCQIVFWNGTDLREQQKLLSRVYDNLIDLVLRVLESEFILPLKNLYDGVPFLVVKGAIGILHNFCHNSDTHITDMRNRGTLAILKRFVSLDNTDDKTHTELKIKAVIVSTYLQKENDEKNHLALNSKAVALLVEQMGITLDTGQEGPAMQTGYHADELLNGLNNIASIELNKGKLIEANVLPLYVQAMKSDSAAVKLRGAQGVWSLSFDKAAKQRIIEDTECMTVLKFLKNSDSESLKKAAQGALWQIRGETDHVRRLETSGNIATQKKHLMISYNWGSQAEVLKFKDRLVEAGYRVWIDVQEMRGSTMEAMAKAVENAAIFIPFLTEKYKNSQACRQEGEYANRLGRMVMPILLQPSYKPDGWLGFMIGSLLYYDLTNPDKYESRMLDFFRDLEKHLSENGTDVRNNGEPDRTNMITSESTSEVPSSTPTAAHSKTLDAKTLINTKLDCYKWSEQQVKEWFSKNGLYTISNRIGLGDVDGRKLAELVHTYLNHEQVYFSYMREEWKLSLHDLLKLNSSLKLLYLTD